MQLLQEASKGQEPSKVYKLDLSSRNLIQLPSFRTYDKIRCLLLNFNHLAQVPNLSPLTDLRQLHLQSNSIRQIRNLQPLRNLTFLSLKSNCIERIERINHFTKLQSLLLDHNQLQKVSSLQYLHELKLLSLNYNSLLSIDSLPSFCKLHTLSATHNRIHSIPLLHTCTKLTTLNLSHNNLTQLHLPPSLQTLNASHNKLINTPHPLPYLQHLDVSHNKIQSLPYLPDFYPQLVSLHLQHNSLCCELILLQALAGTINLVEIDFTDNPMHSTAFEHTLLHLHHFDCINGRCINPPGTKYYDEAKDIELHFQDDDEEERKIRFSGFYNQQLETKMSGLQRPTSPTKNKTQTNCLNQVQKTFREFTQNNKKIEQLRYVYKTLISKYQIETPEHDKGKTLVESNKEVTNDHGNVKEECKEEVRMKLREEVNNCGKKREKSFNIRETMKKPRQRQISSSKGINCSNGFNTFKSDYSVRSDLLKTQLQPKSQKGVFPFLKKDR